MGGGGDSLAHMGEATTLRAATSCSLALMAPSWLSALLLSLTTRRRRRRWRRGDCESGGEGGGESLGGRREWVGAGGAELRVCDQARRGGPANPTGTPQVTKGQKDLSGPFAGASLEPGPPAPRVPSTPGKGGTRLPRPPSGVCVHTNQHRQAMQCHRPRPLASHAARGK